MKGRSDRRAIRGWPARRVAALILTVALIGLGAYAWETGVRDQQALSLMCVGTVLGLERASGFAHELGFWWSVAGLEYYMGYIDDMAKRTPADLRAYAHTYIVGKPHVTGVLLSPEDRKALNLTKEELIQGERANVVGVQ